MNITQTQKGELLASIKIDLSKADYEPEVNKALKDYQHKAAVPGFRPGKAPFGMIKKMYGAAVLYDQVNKKVSEALNNHIIENKLDVLGYPLADPEQMPAEDLETAETSSFWFEVALKPTVDVDLSKCKVNRYNVKATEKMIDETIQNVLKSNPKRTDVENVDKDSKMFVSLKQIEGEFEKSLTLHMDQVTSKTIAKQLIGKAKGDVVAINLAKALGSEEAATKILGNDNAEHAACDFNMTINTIYKEEDAQLNEELFNTIFPGQDIKDEAAFRAKVSEEMEKQYADESDRMFLNQAIDTLVENVKFELPDAFMKRWIVENSQGKITAEEVEENYDNGYANSLRWQIIEESIAKKNNELIVKDEEVRDYVRKYFFRNMDYATLDEETKKSIDNIVDNYLKREEDRQNILNQVADQKVCAFLKDNMKVTVKDVDYDGFVKAITAQPKKKAAKKEEKSAE